jgi:subfamily B ATP-binding cassette protein HlyB/CyaB
MNQAVNETDRPAQVLDSGLCALCGIAGYYRIPVDPEQLANDNALQLRRAELVDLVRAAGRIGLKARSIPIADAKRIATIPAPAIFKLRSGEFVVFAGKNREGLWRYVDPITRIDQNLTLEAMFANIDPEVLLIKRRIGSPGIDPHKFGFRWFWPSLWRYRKPLAHVLLASLFVQIFALVTPIFFQVIVDKVLAHKSNATLLLLIVAIMVSGLFDVILQYLRTYALSHTTNRIDVELGQRLFLHLLRLPISYFESRPAGQIVARMRELENIRQFLTGQGLFSSLDLLFTFVFVGVLFVYSWQLSLIVVFSIPIYVAIATALRRPLRETVAEKFNRNAESQQFLVEAVVGIHTVKAAAVEPIMQVQWEEKLAAYVSTAFRATMLAAGGQSGIQYINRATMAMILLFGAWAVMEGKLTVGELIAFNMIASQVTQPILRLSQLWQDFQQTQVSIERLGDVLNSAPEFRPATNSSPPPPMGQIEFKNVVFRYRPGAPDALKNLSFRVRAGETIGIVGPSGSGKSTLAKLIQRLYSPIEGQILVDGIDLSQVDPSWIRRNIGVVLQENVLFNRSVHDNIAFSNPTLRRSQVIELAQLAGAHEFISKLPGGYDHIIDERGSNLSGGQRQRIAIARALALNPPILIFDEATSALDYESERIIQSNMVHIARNRTVIIIAHRLNAVKSCNRIFGLVDGNLVESGSPRELLGNEGGLYARLWKLQNEQAAA